MPWTPAQRRLFFAQAERGEITHAEAERRAKEGTRTDVDRTGHARKSKRKSRRKASRRGRPLKRVSVRRTTKRAARKATRRRS